jgi:hypothetical protein
MRYQHATGERDKAVAAAVSKATAEARLEDRTPPPWQRLRDSDHRARIAHAETGALLLPRWER